MIKKKKKKVVQEPLFDSSPFGICDEGLNKRVKQRTSVKDKRTKLIPEPYNQDNADRAVPKASKLHKPNKEIKRALEVAENIVEIPKEQIDAFLSQLVSSSEGMSKLFLECVAPTLISFNESMAYSSLALKDGLSYPNSVDAEILPLVEWSARLSLLNYIIRRMPLPKAYRDRFMDLTILKAVEDSFKRRGPQTPLDTTNKVGIITKLSPESGALVKANTKSQVGTVKTKSRSRTK